jgi:hypothetical protein
VAGVPDFQTTLTIRWAAPDDDAARDDVDRWLSQLTPGVDSVLVDALDRHLTDLVSEPGTLTVFERVHRPGTPRTGYNFPGCTRRPLRWAPSCRLHRWWRAWLEG